MQDQHEKLAGANPPGVFLAARYPDYDHWTPVGYLTRERVFPDAPPSGRYLFSYVRAAKDQGLPHLWGRVFPDAPPSGRYLFSYARAAKDQGLPRLWGDGAPDWESLYASDELPPPFSWRIRDDKSRKDYGEYLSALGLTPEEVRANPFTLLARTEGRKVTDWFETFAKPVPKDGRYDIPFFLRGLRHFLKKGDGHFNLVVDRVKALEPGEELLLMPDPQNPADPNAVAVRTADRMLIGYCPRYLARDFRRFLSRDGALDGNLKVRAQKINANGSLSLALLCRLTCDAAPDFAPCADSDFEILSDKMRKQTSE